MTDKANFTLSDTLSKTGSDENSLQLEHEIILQEHQIANAQILHYLETDNKGFEFTLAAIGAIVVASAFIVERKAYFLLLLLTFPFHAITWIQARRGITSTYLGNYIKTVSAPRLRRIVQRKIANKEQSTFDFPFWEEYITTGTKRSRLTRTAMFLAHFGKTFLQFGTAIFLVVAYFLFRDQDPQYVSTVFDTALFIANIVAGLISVFAVTVAVGFLGGPKEN